MKKKPSRRRVEVNVEELDRILDSATQTPMSAADCQKVKAAVSRESNQQGSFNR